MQGDSVLLRQVLERSDMREKFANAVCDLIGGAFSEANVNAVMDELIKKSDTECMYALENGYTSSWARAETFADSRQQIRDFAKMRATIMLNAMSERFDYEKEYYTVVFNNPTGANGSLNTQTLTYSGAVSAEYFSDCKVPLFSRTLNGYEFDHWEVNGIKYDTEKIRVDSSMADDFGVVIVNLYVNRTETADSLYVSELYTSGDGDWIEIYNPTSSEISLADLYLSDDELNLQRWAMPDVKVEPGKVYTVVCKNNSEKSALKKYQTNFSLKTGETLYLSDENGDIISSVAVVGMEENQSLSRGLDGNYKIGSISENTHIEN